MRVGVLLLVCVSIMFGCSLPFHSPRVHIADIQNEPQNYRDRQVLVKGRVVETLAIPFVEKGMYRVDDGTDRIWIVSQGTVPFRGEKVTVKGKVRTGFTVLKRTFGTIIVEEANR